MPKTYAQAVTQSRQALAQARLADPDEHFPYKHDVVTELLADPQTPMGSGVPDAHDGTDDRSRTISDYMSQGIADATRDYVQAQTDYLSDPENDDARTGYEAARDQLIAARLDHRENRGSEFVVGAAARRAG